MSAATAPAAPQEPAPRLTRSTSDRWIAGVAGGLAAHLRVDPLLVRLAFVVTSALGGFGLVAYLLLAVVLPSDGGPVSPRSRAATVALTAAAAVLAVAVLGFPAFVAGPVLLPLVLLAGIAVLLQRALAGDDAERDAGATVARAALAVLALVAALGAGLAVGLAAALGGGVAVAVGAVVAAIALIVAGLLGGRRWLLLPVLVLVAPLAIVQAAGIDLRGGVGRHEYRVTGAADLQPEYRLGMGRLVLDLTDLDVPRAGEDVKVAVGIGEAVVRAPAGACVTADARVGVGSAQLPGHEEGGVDVALDRAEPVAPGALRVHADAGVGSVWVYGDGCA
jgi:phage shock protein PspC (stress-responsive transcriptional regulator)